MKKILTLILIFLLAASLIRNVLAVTPTVAPGYATCDKCGYCPPNPAPQSWSACQKCLYPGIPSDPLTNTSLLIGPSGFPPTPAIGKQYTFLGCLGNGTSFSQSGSVAAVVQTLLNIIFSTAGGIAFLSLIYGSFVVATSQANPERLNYGKRVVYGAIVGLIFTLGSVFIINLIASGILKIPGFSGGTGP